MKNKKLIITTIALFLLVNLKHFWEGETTIWAFPIFIFLAILFLALSIICLIQIGKGVIEKFSNRNRNWTIVVMTTCLGLIFLKPHGLIDFEKLEGEDLFKAQREGAANCMTTFTLKPNNKFKERSVCFGVSEVTGNYEIKNDTIFFSNVSLPRSEKAYYAFGILKKSKYQNEKAFLRYRNRSDTVGDELWITKNEIMK